MLDVIWICALANVRTVLLSHMISRVRLQWLAMFPCNLLLARIPCWFVSSSLLLPPLLLLRPREKALIRDPRHKGAAANLARIRESQQQGGAGGVMEAVERGARAIHRAVAATAATAATAAARGNLASA